MLLEPFHSSFKNREHQPRYPLIQGGMGVGISGPNLAGNVALHGGVGTIASVGLACNQPYYTGRNYFEANQRAVREGLIKAREIAGEKGVLAVNCMVALTDYELHVRSACEGGVNIIISVAGLPIKLPDYTKDFPEVALVPIVSSAKAASLIARRWERLYNRLPDGFVVETPLYAGGHLGVTKMEQVENEEFFLRKLYQRLLSMWRKS